LKVTLSNVLMTVNRNDEKGTHALARELGIAYTLDPTVTPKMDGDPPILSLRVNDDELDGLFNDPELVGDVEEYCKPPAPVDDDAMEGYPRLATFRRTGTYSPACSFPCPRETYADRSSPTSGTTPRRCRKCAPFGPKTSRCAPPVRMPPRARAVLALPTWKEACGGLPLPIARSRTTAPDSVGQHDSESGLGTLVQILPMTV
jgi:hypothetical protein